MEKVINPSEMLDVLEHTLQTFKKHVVRNCDQETANRILRSTKRDLKKLVPK